MSKEMYTVYQEIALEREHVCSGCGTNQRLSHSHLIPKSWNQSLKTVKQNIVYHCMSLGETIGCHNIHESVAFWKLNDAHGNMEYIYSVDPTYFWLRLDKAIDYYSKKLEVVLACYDSIGKNLPKEASIKAAEYNTALNKLNRMKEIPKEQRIEFKPVTPESYIGDKSNKYKF